MQALDAIWAWYEVARDSLHLVWQLVERYPEEIPAEWVRGRVFELRPRDQVLEELRNARQELDDLVVVALFAAFEQQLLDHFEAVVREAQRSAQNPLHRRIFSGRLKKPRNWKLYEILDCYKAVADPNAIGEIKQIYQYRNWVAHGRREKRPPSITPESAYARLHGFLQQIYESG